LKNATIPIVLIVLMLGSSFTALAFTPRVKGAVDDVQILSYSWYNIPGYDVTNGDFIIVGEVQNFGAKIISDVVVQCIVFTTDGEARATGGNVAFVKYLTPGQKAPFYIDLTAANSYSKEMAWTALVDQVRVFVTSANETDLQQYQGLTIASDSTAVIDGVYTVNGYIKNTGDQNSGPLRMVTTFYNDSGTVVAVNVTDVLINSLTPGNLVSFSTKPADHSLINSQITSHSLLIQSEKIGSNPSSTPSSSQLFTPSSSESPSSSPQPTASSGSQQASIPPELIYGVLVAVIIVLVIVVVVMLRKPRQSSQSEVKSV
jgi:hypothetical protein